MVSPVDGPGPPPGSYLPVPTGGSAVVPYLRPQSEASPGPRDGIFGRQTGSAERRSTVQDAVVATPLGADRSGAREIRSNPFLERGETFRRPLLGPRTDAAFLAQAIGQETARANGPGEVGGTDPQREAADAVRRYQAVQDTVDRDVGRRRSPPGIDILA